MEELYLPTFVFVYSLRYTRRSETVCTIDVQVVKVCCRERDSQSHVYNMVFLSLCSVLALFSKQRMLLL